MYGTIEMVQKYAEICENQSHRSFKTLIPLVLYNPKTIR